MEIVQLSDVAGVFTLKFRSRRDQYVQACDSGGVKCSCIHDVLRMIDCSSQGFSGGVHIEDI